MPGVSWLVDQGKLLSSLVTVRPYPNTLPRIAPHLPARDLQRNWRVSSRRLLRRSGSWSTMYQGSLRGRVGSFSMEKRRLRGNLIAS